MTERSNWRVENGKNEKEWIVFGKICYLSFIGNLPVLLVALIGSKRFSKVEWAEDLKQSGFEAQAIENCTPKIAGTLIRYCTSHVHTSNSLLKCFLFERKLMTVSKGRNKLFSVFSCCLLQWCRLVMLHWQPSCPSWPCKCEGFTTLSSTWMREAFGTQASVLHSELPGAQGHRFLLRIKISSSLPLPSHSPLYWVNINFYTSLS